VFTFNSGIELLLERFTEIVPTAIAARLGEACSLALRPSLLRGSPLPRWKGEQLARVHCQHDAITLATIHGAKGLEFTAVLFLGFEKDSVPFVRADDYDEEIRKVYVTVTRSSNLLMYGHGVGKGSPLLKDPLGLI